MSKALEARNVSSMFFFVAHLTVLRLLVVVSLQLGTPPMVLFVLRIPMVSTCVGAMALAGPGQALRLLVTATLPHLPLWIPPQSRPSAALRLRFLRPPQMQRRRNEEASMMNMGQAIVHVVGEPGLYRLAP